MPERVFQLGDGEFPPLKSLYRTNLPIPATPFLGRERELADVVELLAREDARLVTLAGPGGSGKTRLVPQAAAEIAEPATASTGSHSHLFATHPFSRPPSRKGWT